MWVEYQRFDWKEYVSLKRYYNLLCKCKALEKENEKLKDKFMLKLAEAYLLSPTSNQMAEYKKRNFSKWYDEIKNQMRKEIKEGN